MPIRVKTAASTWSVIKKVFAKVNTTATGWKEANAVWGKTPFGWVKMWPGDAPSVNPNDPINIRSGGYNGTVVPSPQSLNAVLYGHDGNGASVIGATPITITNRNMKISESLDGTTTRYQLETVDIYNLTNDSEVDVGYKRFMADGWYLFYQLDAANVWSDKTTLYSFPPIKLIRQIPAHTTNFPTLAESLFGGQPFFTFNFDINDQWYKAADLSRSYIKWWQNTSKTPGGTALKTTYLQDISGLTEYRKNTTYSDYDGRTIANPTVSGVDTYYASSGIPAGQYIIAEIVLQNSYTDHYGSPVSVFRASGDKPVISSLVVRDDNGNSVSDNRSSPRIITDGWLNFTATVTNALSTTYYLLEPRIYNNQTGVYYDFNTTTVITSTSFPTDLTPTSTNFNAATNTATVTWRLYINADTLFGMGGPTYDPGSAPGTARWNFEFRASARASSTSTNASASYYDGVVNFGASTDYQFGIDLPAAIDISPSSAMTLNVNSTTVGANNPLTFSLTTTSYPSTTPGPYASYPRRYFLNYGDGSTPTSGTFTTGTSNPSVTSISKTYTTPGTYTAVLTWEPQGDTSRSTRSRTITVGQALTAPTPGTLSYNSSTTTVTLTFSGTNIGPYYQMYWNSSASAQFSDYYDSATNASGATSISDLFTPIADTLYYFYVRSSNQNIATTTNAGNATTGTYSQWSSFVTATFRRVTFNYNGNGQAATITDAISGTSITLPSPTRTGFTFNGWYTAASGGTRVGGAGESYTATTTLTLYAQWTANPRATGAMRRISMPTSFTNSSQTIWVGTNGYVSTTIDPTTSPGTSWPSAGGVVVGPFVMDLQQTALFTKSDASNFYVRYQGYRFGATSETVDYLMKFYWGSTTVDVYFITNNLTIEPSPDAVRSGTNVFQTWAGSSSITGMTIPTGMTTVTTAPTASADDGRTAITASAPVSLTPPTITSVQNIGGGTLRINFSGGSGPYFQVYWLGSNTTPSNTQTTYDAATNTSTTFIDEALNGSAGTTYYFWVRSSNQNIATTTSSGSATAGTFSNWSTAGSYTFPTVDQSTAPSQPAAPSNNWTSGTSYPFTWSAPSSSGLNTNGTTATITGYTLEIYKADNSSGSGTYASPWATYNFSGSITSYTYTSDDSSKYYAAAVKATNSANKTSTISAKSLYK